MAKPHAVSILKQKGGMMRTARMEQGMRDAALPVGAGWRKELRKRDIATLSYRDTEPWLRLIGAPLGNNNAKRRQALFDHFEDKPDDYKLVL